MGDLLMTYTKEQVSDFIQSATATQGTGERYKEALNQLNLKSLEDSKLYGYYVNAAKQEPALRKLAKKIRKGKV